MIAARLFFLLVVASCLMAASASTTGCSSKQQLCPTNTNFQVLQGANLCTPVSQEGWLLAGQHYTTGRYRLVVQPGVGGVFVSIESVYFFRNCSSYTSKVAIGITWQNATNADGTPQVLGQASGSYQFNADGVPAMPVEYMKGWGPMCEQYWGGLINAGQVPGPVSAYCATIDWNSPTSFKPRVWLYNSNPCARFDVVLHFSTCPGTATINNQLVYPGNSIPNLPIRTAQCDSGFTGCQTTVARGLTNNCPVGQSTCSSGSLDTGGNWFSQTAFTDCAACATPPPNNTQWCGQALYPNCKPGFEQTESCPYVAVDSLCTKYPDTTSCWKGTCDALTYSCQYTKLGEEQCPRQGPQPKILCASCKSDSSCVAQIGYSTAGLVVDADIAAAGAFVYPVGAYNQITGAGTTKTNWGQPTSFLLDSVVTVAATIEYQRSNLPLTWTLGTYTVTVNASTPACTSACLADPGQITVNAYRDTANSNRYVLTYLVDTTVDASCNQPDLTFTIDTSGCDVPQQITVRSVTSPDVNCRDASVAPTPSYTYSANNPLNCLFLRVPEPYVIGIVNSAACRKYAVTLVYANTCLLGNSYVGTQGSTACNGCETCSVTQLLGPKSCPNTLQQQCLTVAGNTWVDCQCRQCTKVTSCPGGQVVDSSGCNCVPCTQPTCNANQRLSADGCSCVCNTITSCPAGSTLVKGTGVNGNCDQCQPCSIVSCPGPSQIYADASQCRCKNCPACPSGQVPIDSNNWCAGCKDCPAPASCPANSTYNAAVDRCKCTPCFDCKVSADLVYIDAGNICNGCCRVATCLAKDNVKPNPADPCSCLTCANDGCLCNDQPPSTCSPGSTWDWTSCSCQPCSCPASNYNTCPTCDGSWTEAACCTPCDYAGCVCQGAAQSPSSCSADEQYNWDSCSCEPCPYPVTCPAGTRRNTTSTCDPCEPCPTPTCVAPEYQDAADPCSCSRCPEPVCGAGTEFDGLCGCTNCTVVCTANYTKATPASANPDCDPCVKCTPKQCPTGQHLADPSDLCSPCVDCLVVCDADQIVADDGCSCLNCADVFPDLTCTGTDVPSPTGCYCEPCATAVCAAGFTLDPANPCQCVAEPPPPPPPSCPYYDACGLCRGRNRTCIGCEGEVGGRRFTDACGVVCGDGSTCPSCVGSLCSICTETVDLCGVCGGDSSTCDGCDGVPASGAIYDWCGVCNGNGTSCLGCDGLPNTSACVAVPPAAIAAVTSLTALAALSCIALAFILWRMRKRPDMLFQAWDQEIDTYMAQLETNPLFFNDGPAENPLHGAAS